MIPSFSKVLLGSTTAFVVYGTAFVIEAGIDLTPTVSEYTAEGMKFQQLIFQYNKQRIQYEPPSRWTFDGNSAALHLKPPRKNFAEAVIEAVPVNKPESLDAAVIKRLEDKLIADLPGDSQLVKVEQETESPLLLNGNRTFEVIVSYQLMGEKFCRSALFANLSDAQLTFRFTARKDDFEWLHHAFRTSILSWHATESSEAPSQLGSTGPSTAGR